MQCLQGKGWSYKDYILYRVIETLEGVTDCANSSLFVAVHDLLPPMSMVDVIKTVPGMTSIGLT